VTGPVGQGELVRWDWIVDHLPDIWIQTLEHLQLTGLAVGIGLLISFPVAVYASRHGWAYAPTAWVAGILYTIPSLALFPLLIPFTGLSFATAEIGLVSYTLLILIRNIVAGLAGVPADVKEAAVGMGYSRGQVLWRVELPLALPAIVAGVRIAVVTTIGLVTITALIGFGGLGIFILRGLRTFFSTSILVGGILSVVLAILADAVLLLAQRVLTPWAARRSRIGAFA
jgi:osmoprotectant transport system permease protein